jgi:hypothetical protein
VALDESALSPRELAVRFTDTQGYFEASVYRLLKVHGLIARQSSLHRDEGCGRVQGFTATSKWRSMLPGSTKPRSFIGQSCCPITAPHTSRGEMTATTWTMSGSYRPMT